MQHGDAQAALLQGGGFGDGAWDLGGSSGRQAAQQASAGVLPGPGAAQLNPWQQCPELLGPIPWLAAGGCLPLTAPGELPLLHQGQGDTEPAAKAQQPDHGGRAGAAAGATSARTEGHTRGRPRRYNLEGTSPPAACDAPPAPCQGSANDTAVPCQAADKRGRGPKPKYVFPCQQQAAVARKQRNREAALVSYYRKKARRVELSAEAERLAAENAALERLSAQIQRGARPLAEASNQGIDRWLADAGIITVPCGCE